MSIHCMLSERITDFHACRTDSVVTRMMVYSVNSGLTTRYEVACHLHKGPQLIRRPWSTV